MQITTGQLSETLAVKPTESSEGGESKIKAISDILLDHSTDNKCQPGERFHMDMGFVRGTKYNHKDEDGRIITSLDGFNSYLLIIDRTTWYIWVFLSKYKTPRIDIIKTFLKTHGAQHLAQQCIRTDEGGELWGSHEFQRAVQKSGFILEPTAPDSSFQNGMAE